MRNHYHLAVETPQPNLVEGMHWLQSALTATLTAFGRTSAELAATAKGADWKVALARILRATVAPPYGWLAEHLNMGKASSVRVYISRRNQQPAD